MTDFPEHESPPTEGFEPVRALRVNVLLPGEDILPPSMVAKFFTEAMGMWKNKRTNTDYIDSHVDAWLRRIGLLHHHHQGAATSRSSGQEPTNRDPESTAPTTASRPSTSGPSPSVARKFVPGGRGRSRPAPLRESDCVVMGRTRPAPPRPHNPNALVEDDWGNEGRTRKEPVESMIQRAHNVLNVTYFSEDIGRYTASPAASSSCTRASSSVAAGRSASGAGVLSGPPKH